MRIGRTTWIVTFALGIGAGVPAGESAFAQRPAERLRLELNVPESRLHVYENGRRTREYRVSVGMEGHETPAGQYRISHAVWNPWWHPPDSRWARGRKAEPPGPANPMGRIKLHFSRLLYIHGTAEVQRLGWPSSHGCVRLANEDLLELARLVHEHGSPRVPAQRLDELERNAGMTRRIALTRPVRFDVVYRVAEVRDGFLHIFPDPYDRVGDRLRDRVTDVLERHGIDTRAVDAATLDRLIRKGRSRKVAVSLEDLAAPGVADPGPGASVLR